MNPVDLDGARIISADDHMDLHVMPPRLFVDRVPASSRDDVPMWGRTKLIRDAVAAGKAWPIERVLAVDNSRSMPTDE